MVERSGRNVVALVRAYCLLLVKTKEALEGVNMQSTTVSMEIVDQMSPADVAELAGRLEQDAYTNVFDGLNDWHLLRAIAFKRPELVTPYLELLDLEHYDES